METIKLFAIGIILGVANVIPGVSGGTMAVVFGIYNRLIDLISLNVKKIFSQWKKTFTVLYYFTVICWELFL
jgi:putative membrane protein